MRNVLHRKRSRQAICLLAASFSWLCLTIPGATVRADEPVVMVGKASGAEFRDLPTKEAKLVGLVVHVGISNHRPLISGVACVYRADGREFEGNLHGELGIPVRSLARPGYAVGAILAQAGEQVVGLRLVFMREQSDQLDPQDSYQGRWIGFRRDGAEVKLDAKGIPIVGLRGSLGESVSMLAPIFRGSEDSVSSATLPLSTSAAAPGPKMPPTAAPPLPHFTPAEAAAALTKIGARLNTDKALPGEPITGVDFYGLQLRSESLAPLASLPGLEAVNLSFTYREQDRDLGLGALSQLEKLRELHLRGVWSLKNSDLAHLSNVTSLRFLDISSTHTSGDALSELHQLVNLETLHAVNFDDLTLKHLQTFKNLRKLMLFFSNVTDQGLKQIVMLPNVTEFYLGSPRITDAGLKTLGQMKQLEQLQLEAYPRTTDDFDWSLSSAGLEHLVNLPQLKLLQLYRFRLTSDACKPISKIQTLRHLDLSVSSIGDNDVAHLAKLKQLEVLSLQDDPITDVGLMQLAGLKRLKVLYLGGTRATDDGLAVLAGMKHLEDLSLTRTPISTAGLRHISGLDSMVRFTCERSEIRDEALEHLAGLTRLEVLALARTQMVTPRWGLLKELVRLRDLYLSHCPLTDEGLEQIDQLSGLRKLVLLGTKVSDVGLAHIAKLTDLEELDLAGVQITDAGLTHLKKMSKLKVLNLSVTKITDDGLKRLESLANLEKLGLEETVVSDQSIESLARIPQLRSLNLRRTRVTPKGAKRLQQTAPNLIVFRGWPSAPDPRPR